MKNDHRVLNRIGARELTIEETRQVTGSQIVHTDNCTLYTLTMTGSGDGDGCSDFDHDV